MYSCDATDRSRNSVMDSPQWGQVVSAVVSSMGSLTAATEATDRAVVG